MSGTTRTLRHFMAVTFYTALTWFLYRARIYVGWSRLYRRVYNLPYYDKTSDTYSPVEATHDPLSASEAMSKIKWYRDGLRELWDAIAHPSWFQYNLNLISSGGKQEGRAMDCDEYAAWAQAAVEPRYAPVFLNLIWLSPVPTRRGRYRYKVNGHSVCLVRHQNKDGSVEFQHIGNWGPSKRSPRASSLVRDLIPHESTLIRWTILDGSLRLVGTSGKVEELDLITYATDE